MKPRVLRCTCVIDDTLLKACKRESAAVNLVRISLTRAGIPLDATTALIAPARGTLSCRRGSIDRTWLYEWQCVVDEQDKE